MNENEEKNRNLRVKQQKESLIKKLVICALILVFLTVIFVYVNRNATGTEIDLQIFQEQLDNGNISRIELNQSKIQIYYKKDNEAHWLHRRESIENYVLEQWTKLESQGKDVPELVSGTTTTVSIINILYPLIGIAVSIVMIVFILRQFKGANNKNYEFVKSRARITPSKTKFADVAGADEEKEELKDVVDFLMNPKKYSELGAKIPKGVILVGPPGTGKTLLARAVAGEANVPFFTISGSDFMELFVGVGASRVRDLFENAKKAKPCIIFIDEIDAVGRQRGAGLGGGNDEREQTLNQLLVQMDGFEENEGIIVMAATNRVDILDPALLRPGRFDRRINIAPPDIKGREEILNVHARNKHFDESVNFKTIARITAGFTGAELENLLNESAILVAKENRKLITEEDIQKSIMKVSLGPQKRSRILDEKDKQDTAIHESGHALISRLAKSKTPVHEVSIIPRGWAGGYTVSTDDDSSVYFREKLICKIQMLLGGITAEKLYVGDVSTGASNDLKRATSIARRMVTEWGMSENVGMVYCGGGDEVFIGKSYQERVPYSEEQGKIIDAEIKKIIDECQAETERLLVEHKDKLMTMVDILLEKETIYTEEVEMILNGKSKEEIIDFIDSKENKNKSQDSKNDNQNDSEKDFDNYVDKLLKTAEDREKEAQNASECCHSGNKECCCHSENKTEDTCCHSEGNKETCCCHGSDKSKDSCCHKDDDNDETCCCHNSDEIKEKCECQKQSNSGESEIKVEEIVEEKTESSENVSHETSDNNIEEKTETETLETTNENSKVEDKVEEIKEESSEEKSTEKNKSLDKKTESKSNKKSSINKKDNNSSKKDESK